ncbi:hypothetical protein ACVWWO_002747 [Bradyrhizobium sp. F1.13.1]
MERRHHVQSGELRVAPGLLACGLKVLAMFNKLCAKRLHRAVLLDRIAARHIDHGGHAMAARRKSEALTMIAARRRDDARNVRPFALQPIEIDQPAAHLEGACRRVILVLDEDLRAEPLGEQRPGVRRRCRHRLPHDRMCAFELVQVEHFTFSSIHLSRLSSPRRRGSSIPEAPRAIERPRRTGSPGQAGR